MYKQTYSKLILTELDPEQMEAHGGYRYVISNSYSSHSAFRTLAGLARWMNTCGLTFGEAWNLRISGKSVHLSPGYSTISLMDVEYYETIKALHHRIEPWLSNGDYVEGIVLDAKPMNTIVYLNPNCERVVYDYKSIIK